MFLRNVACQRQAMCSNRKREAHRPERQDPLPE